MERETKRARTIQYLKDICRASVSVRREWGIGYKLGKKKKEIHRGGWRDIFMAQEMENFGWEFQRNESGSWLSAKLYAEPADGEAFLFLIILKDTCSEKCDPWTSRSICKLVRNAHYWAQHMIYWRRNSGLDSRDMCLTKSAGDADTHSSLRTTAPRGRVLVMKHALNTSLSSLAFLLICCILSTNVDAGFFMRWLGSAN